MLREGFWLIKYIIWYLVNDNYGKLFSNIPGLEEIEVTVINCVFFGSNGEKCPIFYPKPRDMYLLHNWNIRNMTLPEKVNLDFFNTFYVPKAVIIDCKYWDLAYVEKLLEKFYCIKFLVILSYTKKGYGLKEILFDEQYSYLSESKHNIFFIDDHQSNIFRKFYGSQCAINNAYLKGYEMHSTVYKTIEKFILYLFYISLIFFVCISFIILGMWLRIRAKRDPIITSSELNSCPVRFYKDLVDKNMFDSCLICIDLFNDFSKCRILHCGHYFHKECVDPWLKSKSCRCPYCRKIIKKEPIV
ncbi:Ring finger domain-containing protein [Hamiltosporidium magnivora]|uniref:Ring finger domain-containing protein n=1 Tax=Hamiltosporidium magnivora TaxID=148818 RepID=A0A4Q9KXE0_9MICR|nr:Ring finger domain-containing protein [Hamiltosporidium magnivora]